MILPSAAFNGIRATQGENPQARAASGQRVLEDFGRTAVERGGHGFDLRHTHAANLGAIHALKRHQLASGIDDGNRHRQVLFAGVGHGASHGFSGLLVGDVGTVLRHLRLGKGGKTGQAAQGCGGEESGDGTRLHGSLLDD